MARKICVNNCVFSNYTVLDLAAGTSSPTTTKSYVLNLKDSVVERTINVHYYCEITSRQVKLFMLGTCDSGSCVVDKPTEARIPRIESRDYDVTKPVALCKRCLSSIAYTSHNGQNDLSVAYKLYDSDLLKIV